jgi:class 3 adenylate cyclase
MTEIKAKEITALVNDSLDEAEGVWGKVGSKLMNRAMAKSAQFSGAIVEASTPTTFPGYEVLEEGKPLVDEFIALVLDMRDSSNHLNCAITGTKAQMLERVFYETAALLPACSKLISDEKGGVTEYLGDGLLAFFRVDESEKAEACYAAHRAASGCMKTVSEIINPILDGRYDLPKIEIGIGMSVSKAVLTVTGQANFVKPVAFGQCLYHATKLSKGRGEIIVDEALHLMWPKSDDGPLRFSFRMMRDNIKGYVIQNTK